jgi:hypothetical protein
MTNSFGWVEGGREKVLALLPSSTPGRQWKIGDVLLWWRSVGIELAGDAERRHYIVGRDSVDQRAPERPIDDGAVIDEPRDKSDRTDLAYQRGAEADLIDPNGA